MKVYVHTKYLYVTVSRSFIHNSQNLKIQMLINWWTDKQIMVDSHSGILLSIDKEQIMNIPNNMDEP